MADTNYLRSVAEQTPTAWWHDSEDPEELERETKIEQLRKTLTQFYHSGWAFLKSYEG